MPPRLRVT